MSSSPTSSEIQPLPGESRWEAITRERKQRMTAVQITGLTRIAKPKPNQGGSIILAYFDCQVAGFALNGCALVRTRKNGLVAWAPSLDGPESRRRSITIVDDSIRHAMMLEARETYRLMGGTDAEWIGRSIPQGPLREINGQTCPLNPELDNEPLLERADCDDLDVSGVARFLGAEPREARG